MFNGLTVLLLMQPHSTRPHIREFPELATSLETRKKKTISVPSSVHFKMIIQLFGFFIQLSPFPTCKVPNGSHYWFKRGAGFVFEQRQYAVAQGDYKQSGTDKTPTRVNLRTQQRTTHWFIATLKWTHKLSYTHRERDSGEQKYTLPNPTLLTHTHRGKCFEQAKSGQCECQKFSGYKETIFY